MKRFFLIVVALAFLGTTLTTNAQKIKQVDTYNQTLYVNPFGLIFGIINAAYEHKLSPENSFTVSLFYWKWSDWWTGLGIGGSYRWYFDLFKENKNPLEGFSVGPRVDLYKWSYDHAGDVSYSGGTSIYIGAEAAYKWVFGGGWTIEPNFTINFPVSKVEGLSTNNYGFGVGFGYSWK